MTDYPVPDPVRIQAKADRDLAHLLKLLQELSANHREVYVQVSWPANSFDLDKSVKQSFGFPVGVELRPPSAPENPATAPVDLWQAKDNSFRAGYQRGYYDAQESRAYNDQPAS